MPNRLTEGRGEIAWGLRRDFDINQSPFKTHGDPSEASVQFCLDLVITPLSQRLLGPAQFGVLGDEPHDAFQHLRAVRPTRRRVEVLLDHHGGKPRRAAEVVHQSLQQFTGVGDVLSATRCTAEKRADSTVLDSLHVGGLLLLLLAAIGLCTADKAADIPLPVLPLAEVIWCLW